MALVSSSPTRIKSELPISGEKASYCCKDFSLASGQSFDAKLVYTLNYNGRDPFDSSKEIVVLHPALTGSCMAFKELAKGKTSQGDGWAQHLKDLDMYDLDRYTVLVVEPLGGNANCDGEGASSMDEVFSISPKLALSPEDTVNLVTTFLQTHEIERINRIDAYSMGGSMIQSWSQQNAIKVDQFLGVYTGLSVPGDIKQFWQIALDLLVEEHEPKPNFKRIANQLVENFAVQNSRDPFDAPTFDICIHCLAHQIEQLGDVYDSFPHNEYLNVALREARKYSFLRYQTKDEFNKRNPVEVLSFLGEQGENFTSRMSPRNYRQLCRQLLDDFYDPNCIVSPIPADFILDSSDILYDLDHYRAEIKASLSDVRIHVVNLEQGHDGFLTSEFTPTMEELLDSTLVF